MGGLPSGLCVVVVVDFSWNRRAAAAEWSRKDLFAAALLLLMDLPARYFEDEKLSGWADRRLNMVQRCSSMIAGG